MHNITQFATLFAACFIFFVLYKRLVGSWIRNDFRTLSKIPGPPNNSWLKGNMLELFDRNNGPQFHKDLVTKYDRIAKVRGFLGDAQLYVSDPQALHSIIVKDQDVYEETRVFIDNNKIIFGEGLVATVGEHHKRQRRLITPVFSVQRLRSLVPIFHNVASRLQTALSTVVKSDVGEDRLPSAEAEIDMSEWMSRAAIESIGCAGLGHSLDPLDSPATNPYTKTVRELIPALFSIALLRLVTPFVLKLGPPGFRRFMLNFVPIRAVQKVKHMSDVMDKTCREILQKKRALRDSGSGMLWDGDGEDGKQARSEMVSLTDGKDIMSILLDVNEAAQKTDMLSDAELLGQMNVLIFGAQDTTSSALSRLLHILSQPENASLQAELRDEIAQATEGRRINDLDYDDFVDGLPLLDAVLKETLRLYPPVPFVRRVAIREAVLPLSRPILLTDGSSTSSITVPKGTTIWVSIAGANTSKDVWGPTASEWNHRRWLSQNDGVEGAPDETIGKESGRVRLPGVFAGMLTFFGGGRSCIGYRFALVEMKIILATLLSVFTFSLSPAARSESCLKGSRNIESATETETEIVWRLSQIVSPSYRTRPRRRTPKGEERKEGRDEEWNEEKQGMPIHVGLIHPSRTPTPNQ